MKLILGVNNMNKKISLIGILAVLMLITIALSATVSSNEAVTERKESPLWRIRTEIKISEKLEDAINNIKSSFFSENRIWSVPLLSRIFERNEPILGGSVAWVPTYCPYIKCILTSYC